MLLKIALIIQIHIKNYPNHKIIQTFKFLIFYQMKIVINLFLIIQLSKKDIVMDFPIIKWSRTRITLPIRILLVTIVFRWIKIILIVKFLLIIWNGYKIMAIIVPMFKVLIKVINFAIIVIIPIIATITQTILDRMKVI